MTTEGDAIIGAFHKPRDAIGPALHVQLPITAIETFLESPLLQVQVTTEANACLTSP